VRIILRAQHASAETVQVFEGEDARETLADVLSADVSMLRYPISSVEEGDLAFLDLDTHHLAEKPSPEELDAWAADLPGPPDFWWRTHGSGLRAVYCGRQHRSWALAAAMSVPSFFTAEVKRDSRHPNGDHPKYPGVSCGPVHTAAADLRRKKLSWASIRYPSPEAIDDALAEHGLARGQRFDHAKCPIAGHAESSARDCVVVNDAAVVCFRCKAEGTCYPGQSRPGIVPMSVLVDRGSAPAVLDELARYFVNWSHARLQLRDAFPNLSVALLREAYHRALRARHGPDDPRVKRVFSGDVRIFLGESSWCDADSLKPFDATKDTFAFLPGLNRLQKDEEGEPRCFPIGPLLDRARAAMPLDGYKPVRIYRGVVFHRDHSVIQLAVPPKEGGPIRLLRASDAMPLEDAFAHVERSFPGLSRQYLQAALAAVICAPGGGRPPILFAIGPTGSGKGETLSLAASFVGDERFSLEHVDNNDQMWRRLGSAVADGRQFLFVDELLRRGRKLEEFVQFLLRLSHSITWRRLYSNSDSITPNRAAFFLAAGSVPDAFKKSPEIRRRMRLVRLFAQVPEWAETCGGETTKWRSLSDQNAHAANSILTAVYLRCAQEQFRFDQVARHLGLSPLDEGDAELQRDVLRRLYRHCRNEFGDRTLHTANAAEGTQQQRLRPERPRYAHGDVVADPGHPRHLRSAQPRRRPPGDREVPRPPRGGPHRPRGQRPHRRAEVDRGGLTQRRWALIAGAATRSLPVAQSPSPNEVSKRLTGRDYLSPSAIATFQRCPLKYRFAYIEGREPEFTSVSLVFGAAIHAAIEEHYRRRFEGLPPPGDDELLAAYAKAWEAETAQRSNLDKEPALDELTGLAARMLTAFQKSAVATDDDAALVGVEEELRGPVVPEAPDVLGRCDLVTTTRSALRVVDFKTSRSAWGQGQVWESSQAMLLYALLARPLAAAVGASQIHLRWVVVTKAKTPRVDVHDLTPSAGQLRRVAETVATVWKAITAGLFYPAPSATNCSMCSYRRACREWAVSS